MTMTVEHSPGDLDSILACAVEYLFDCLIQAFHGELVVVVSCVLGA